jgi:hypothetical protein
VCTWSVGRSSSWYGNDEFDLLGQGHCFYWTDSDNNGQAMDTSSTTAMVWLKEGQWICDQWIH